MRHLQAPLHRSRDRLRHTQDLPHRTLPRLLTMQDTPRRTPPLTLLRPLLSLEVHHPSQADHRPHSQVGPRQVFLERDRPSRVALVQGTATKVMGHIREATHLLLAPHQASQALLPGSQVPMILHLLRLISRVPLEGGKLRVCKESKKVDCPIAVEINQTLIPCTLVYCSLHIVDRLRSSVETGCA
jgi:hypothetical protein